MAAAKKAAAAAKEGLGSGKQRDEEQPLMQPANGFSKESDGGSVKGLGEGKAMMPTPGRVKEQNLGDAAKVRGLRHTSAQRAHVCADAYTVLRDVSMLGWCLCEAQCRPGSRI